VDLKTYFCPGTGDGCYNEVVPGSKHCRLHTPEKIRSALRTRVKVYVAAPYSEAARVREIHKQIKEAGGVVTSIWAEQAAGANEDFSPAVMARAISENDLGVEAADVVLALGFEGKGRAMFGEIRYAISLGIPVHYAGPAYLDVQRPGVTVHELFTGPLMAVLSLVRSG
jgi:hypothetical protein